MIPWMFLPAMYGWDLGCSGYWNFRQRFGQQCGSQRFNTRNWILVGKQILAIVVVWAFAFGMTWIIGKVIDATMGLRLTPQRKSLGLDISQHGESAYVMSYRRLI